MKLHIRIQIIEYKHYDLEGNNPKTTCVIRWINPITGNIQRSVGISRCNPNDKFDIVKGRRIAESRAKINMWNTYNGCIGGIAQDTLDRHFKFICHEEQHLRDLINDVKIN